ncbi:MAG: hypothetical protein ACOC9V_03090 [Chloroflexota bacterium]
MSKLKEAALISTLHDPEGRMARFLPDSLPFLVKLYQFMLVVATPATAADTTDRLREAGVRVHGDGNEHVGENRRRALSRALQREQDVVYHYCDFDRLLHWTEHHRSELQQVVTRDLWKADYVALGRTEAAFASHPAVQRELESVTNRVFSFAFGREMDVTAGSCGISRTAAKFLVQHSTEMSNATDTEWPMLIGQRAGLPVSYVATQGLEFETATFYGPDVFEEAHSADNWARRARLARHSIEAVLRLSDRPQPQGAALAKVREL